MLRTLLTATLLLACFAPSASAQSGAYRIEGVVFLDEGRNPLNNRIEGAAVMAYAVLRGVDGQPYAYELEDREQLAYTDAKGTFVLKLRSDREYELRCVAEGCRAAPQSFAAGSVAPEDNISIEVPAKRAQVVILRGRCLDQNTRQPVEGAKVVLSTAGREVTEAFATGPDGSFLFSLEAGRKYVASASQRNYFFTSTDTLRTQGLERPEIQAELLMPEIVIGQTRRLDGFRFEVNQSDVLPGMRPTLDQLAEMLDANPRLKLIVNCHTDSRGDEQYNLTLTQKRAEAVVAYLVSKGVTTARLKAVGYGETRLLNECGNGILCPTEKHLENRRTEVVITDAF